jgi:hypothetical protein
MVQSLIQMFTEDNYPEFDTCCGIRYSKWVVHMGAILLLLMECVLRMRSRSVQP